MEAARMLGIAWCAPDGSERVSGHSLRVMGAQGLVVRGWDLWIVQLHGRWGSDVIKRYIRDSPLAAVAAGRGPAARQELDLEAVVAAVGRIVQPIGSSCAGDCAGGRLPQHGRRPTPSCGNCCPT